MATLFEDTFERPDGLVGNGWEYLPEDGYISSGRAYTTAYPRSYKFQHLAIGENDHDVTVNLAAGWEDNLTNWIHLCVRASEDLLTRYEVQQRLWSGGGPASFNIYYVTNGSFIGIYSGAASVPPGPLSLKLSVVGGVIEYSVGGVVQGTVNHGSITVGRYAGFTFGNAAKFYTDSCLITDTEAGPGPGGLTITPNPIYGSSWQTLLTIVTAGEEWTPGDPETADLSVDHGSITLVDVVSPTTALVSYAPGAGAATATFTSGLDGSQGTLTINDGSLIDDVTLYILSLLVPLPGMLAFVIELLLSWSGGECDLEDVYRRLGDPPPETSIWYVLLEIWKALYSSEAAELDPASPIGLLALDAASAANDSFYGRQAVEAMRAGTAQTLDAVVSGVNTHTDSKAGELDTAIDAVGTTLSGHHTVVTEQFLGIRTEAGLSLQSVLDALALLGFATPTDVANARNAIMGDPATDNYALLTAIGLIPTNPITSLQPVLDAIAAVRGSGNPDIAAVLTALGLIPTNPITSLQPVLDAIAALPRLPRMPLSGAVTYGVPYPLSDGLELSAPMDGVIVQIETVSAGTGKYMFGPAASWRQAGAVAFQSVDGYLESAQNFSFDGHILVPKTMWRAAGCIVRLGRTTKGTITSWTNP